MAGPAFGPTPPLKRPVRGDTIHLPFTRQQSTVHLAHRAITIDFGALNGGRTRGSWLLKARITNAGWTEDARLPLVFICRADGSRPRIRDERKVWNRVRSAVGRRIRR
ncbi:hypothetical protein [Micromonospora sp. NPDC005189]|uniref:hypothetical protein n=1 Tax=unclassified Micromonospora TaxID=2617518 RepID=UPI0033A08E40